MVGDHDAYSDALKQWTHALTGVSNTIPCDAYGKTVLFEGAHSKAMQDIREHRDVHAAFETVYPNGVDLVSTYEGAQVLLPHLTDSSTNAHPTMYVDAYKSDTQDRIPIRGMVALRDMNTNCGGLVFMSNSHRLMDYFRAAFPLRALRKRSCLPLWDAQTYWYEKYYCTFESVSCQAGDLVVWDARTVYGIASDPRELNALFLGLYISKVPRLWLTDDAMGVLERAKENRCATSYHPNNLWVCKKTPATYGRATEEERNETYLSNATTYRIDQAARMSN
jgi:hypothetical protein